MYLANEISWVIIVGNWKIAATQGYWLCEGTLTQVYSNKFSYDTINFPLEDRPLFFLKQKLSIPSKFVVQTCRIFKRTFISLYSFNYDVIRWNQIRK